MQGPVRRRLSRSELTASPPGPPASVSQSDMQAFKAANPFDPCLPDFVRWYSAKDFRPDQLAEYDAPRDFPRRTDDGEPLAQPPPPLLQLLPWTVSVISFIQGVHGVTPEGLLDIPWSSCGRTHPDR